MNLNISARRSRFLFFQTVSSASCDRVKLLNKLFHKPLDMQDAPGWMFGDENVLLLLLFRHAGL